LADRREGGAAVRFIAVAALGVMIVWAAYLARHALLIIYISTLLAIGFGPIVRAIEHWPGTKRLPRWFAILIVYVVIVGALIAVGMLVIPPLLKQAQELWTALPALLERAQGILIRVGLLDRPITLEEAIRRAPASSGDAVGTVALAATRTIAGVFGFVTILILTFYLLIESDTLFAGFAHLFARGDRPRVREAASKITLKISAWLSGQLMLAGTIGISSAIGLYLLGVPFFYVLALLTAIGEMIPVVGPILSAVPAVLVAFTVSAQTGFLVIVFFVVQQQVENHVLVPKIMSRQVGVSAVTVIVALLIGGTVLGILGAVLAVPSAAILQVVVQELLDERDRREARADHAALR
jgi:predicted PurR-regulated permease PerM